MRLKKLLIESNRSSSGRVDAYQVCSKEKSLQYPTATSIRAVFKAPRQEIGHLYSVDGRGIPLDSIAQKRDISRSFSPWREISLIISADLPVFRREWAASVRVSIRTLINTGLQAGVSSRRMVASRFNGLRSIACPRSAINFRISSSAMVFADRMRKAVETLVPIRPAYAPA